MKNNFPFLRLVKFNWILNCVFFWDCLLLSRSFSIGQTATSEKNKKQNTGRPPQDPTSYLHVGAAVVINLDSCGHRWSLIAQVYQRSSAGGQMGRRRSACLARTRDMMRETAWPTDVPVGWGGGEGEWQYKRMFRWRRRRATARHCLHWRRQRRWKVWLRYCGSWQEMRWLLNHCVFSHKDLKVVSQKKNGPRRLEKKQSNSKGKVF